MAKKQEKEIERWVTVNGARVPIFKDGSIGGPKALRDKVKAKVKDSGESKKLKPRPYKSSYYSEDQLKDEKFRKDALDEMKKHERNWSYYSLSERRNISPNGVKELRDRIKEIENYNKQIKTSGVTRKDVEELTAKKDKLKGTKLDAKPISKKEVEDYKKNNPFRKKGIYSLDKRDDNNFEITNPEKGTKYTVTAKNADDARAKLQKAQRARKTDQFDFQDSDIKPLKQTKAQKTIQENEDLKEKQIKQNKAEKDRINDIDKAQEEAERINKMTEEDIDAYIAKRSQEEKEMAERRKARIAEKLKKADERLSKKAQEENELKERQNYKKEYKNPDAYFSAVSVAERALEQKALSKLEPLPYFSKEARQRDKDIANGKYRTKITDVSKLSLSDLRTVAQSLGKKTEGKSKTELVAMIEKIFKKG